VTKEEVRTNEVKAVGIRERTVKLHRTAITTKLGVPSVAELTRLTQEAGIFTASAPTFPKGQ
jgi:FixJ family two-component response regulator